MAQDLTAKITTGEVTGGVIGKVAKVAIDGDVIGKAGDGILDDSALIEKVHEICSNLSLENFCKTILGFGDLNHIHSDLCRELEFNYPCILVLMPRYSFKSSICTIGYPLWKLIRQPNYRILIYSDASTKAQGFLSSIKAHIEGSVENSFFSSQFKWFDDKKWNESQIIIKARTNSFPEPSIDTGGIETSKVGMHYDEIIFDDIVSDKNVTTKEQMDKVAECYKRSLSLLKPGGKIKIVGTRWHFGDLYGRLIAENDTKRNFKIIVIDGEEDKTYGLYPFSNIGLNKAFLDEQRSKQGSYVFSCLYRNNPVDPETAVFKTTDFSFYGEVDPKGLYITATCDPAGEGEDFTAITVVGTDDKMDMYILEIVNEHLQPSEIIKQIIRLHYKYTFNMFGLEENFYRGMLRQELERKLTEERSENERFKCFGVHEFKATAKRGEGKHNRMMGLQPYHERHALKFPGRRLELLEGNFSTLFYQMIQFPNASHDDILDSLAYHLPLIRRGGLVKMSDIPYHSPAWLERQSRDAEVGMNNLLPRRYRKRIAELTFS